MPKEIKKIEILPIKYVWSILCAGSSIDQQTNNLSLYNLIEELTLLRGDVENQKKTAQSAILPIAFPFQLITLWERSDMGAIETFVKMQLLDPAEKVLNEIEYAVKIEAHQERNRFTVNFNAFPFTADGSYQFKSFVKNRNAFVPVGQTNLKVKLADAIARP